MGCLIIAPLSDRVGRRPCVLACMSLAFLTSVSCTWAMQIGFRNREQVKTSLLSSGRSLKGGKPSGGLLSFDHWNGRKKQMLLLGIAATSSVHIRKRFQWKSCWKLRPGMLTTEMTWFFLARSLQGLSEAVECLSFAIIRETQWPAAFYCDVHSIGFLENQVFGFGLLRLGKEVAKDWCDDADERYQVYSAFWTTCIFFNMAAPLFGGVVAMSSSWRVDFLVLVIGWGSLTDLSKFRSSVGNVAEPVQFHELQMPAVKAACWSWPI